MSPYPLALTALLLCSTAPGQGESPTSITGRVLDVDGRPIAGAAVAIHASGGPDDTARFTETAANRTDAEGRFSLEAPEEPSATIFVAAPGYQACSMRVTQHGGLPTVSLVPGARLFGRLRDPDGAPVAGARISVSSSIAPSASLGAVLSASARSDAEGIFEVVGVPRTGMRVRVHAQGHYVHEQLADQQTPLDVTLEPYRGYARGVVLDERGAAVAGADVWVQGDESVTPVSTDPDGRFAIGVPRSDGGMIEAWCDGVRIRGPELDGPVEGLELRVTVDAAARAAREVALRVTGADGQPVDGFRATIEATSRELSACQAMLRHSMSRSAHEGSQASVPVTRPQTDAKFLSVLVEADGHGWSHRTLPIDHQGPIDVTLSPEATLTGQVVEATGGAPIAGAEIRALPAGTSHGGGQDPALAGITTDANGRFVVRGLRPGSYTVQAHVHGRDATQPVRAVAAQEGGTPCRIEMPAAQRLRFRLMSDDREIPPTAWVSLARDELAQQNAIGHYAYFTGGARLDGLDVRTDDGYEIGPVSSGPYDVTLCVPSRLRTGLVHAFALGRIQTNGPELPLDLPELALHVVRGRVMLPEDVPACRVALVARSAESPSEGLEAMIRMMMARARQQLPMAALDRDGRFEIELPQGEFTLQLVDLESGAAFHTDGEGREVSGPIERLTLRPDVHWLEIRVDEGEPTPHRMTLELPTVNGISTVLMPGSANRGRNQTDFRWPRSQRRLRLLVPAGQLAVGVSRSGMGQTILDPIKIGEREHALTLRR